MPPVYDSPGRGAHRPGTTTYVLPVGPGTVFAGGNQQSRLADIPDGSSNTILALDAAEEHAVLWTKPDDLAYAPSSISAALFGRFGETGLACFCDGSVRRLPRNLQQGTLNALFTRAGGEAHSRHRTIRVGRPAAAARPTCRNPRAGRWQAR